MSLIKKFARTAHSIAVCVFVVSLIAAVVIQPGHRHDRITDVSSMAPDICGGEWYAPDNPYQPIASVSGNKETWYQNQPLGGLSFSDHSYKRYISSTRGDISLPDAIGIPDVVWDLFGMALPNKFQFPNSIPGVISYLSLDTCSGLTPQRSFNYSRQSDREYYIFTNSIVVRSNAYGWHEVRGSIESKYVQQKGWTDWLGIPKSDEIAAPGASGRMSLFTGGRIYYSSATGAHTIDNNIYDKWMSLGGPAGPLGYPIGDDNRTWTPSGAIQSRNSSFQNNCIIQDNYVGTNQGLKAYCNGVEVKTWAPPTPPPPPATNQKPTATFSAARRAGQGNIVYLNGTASKDPDGSIVNWKWTSGSTVLGTTSILSVSMGSATSASITLTITDNSGATASATKALTLSNRAPTLTSVSPPDGSTAGSNTPTLYASANDDDGDALQYNYHITGPSVDVSSGWTGGTWTVPAGKLDPGTQYNWTVTVMDTHGATASKTATLHIAVLPTAQGLVATPSGDGYWQVATDGGVFAFGDAQFYGSMGGSGLTNILGMARTPSGHGYWLVGSDGGVFAFGDAPFAGSLPGLNIHINNIVGMAPTKSGHGYWLVGSDGGVFAFGDAGFYGSMGGQTLNKPVTAIAVTPSSHGYWLAAQDGGVFAFGDAPFYGSLGGQTLNAPIVDIASSPDGNGYWMAAEDGGVFAFGTAHFYGSMAGQPLNGHITGMSPTPNGSGYWLNGCDGGIFAFGNAQFYGSLPRYSCRGF